MLDLALKAGLSMIQVTTDDVLNFEDVLQSIAGVEQVFVQADTFNEKTLKQQAVFWTSDDKLATGHNFELLKHKHRSLVFVNCKPGALAFNAGQMIPPGHLVRDMVHKYAKPSPPLLDSLKGLSLKMAEDVVLLTSAKYGSLDPKNVRSMRGELGQTTQGLYPLDTTLGFYEPIPELSEWLTLNTPYFTGANPLLVPRGLLFNGPAGTGKTIAAKVVASHFQIPLYRLDVATTLNRYIGESEGRLAQALRLLEHEAPCAVLIDEVEKVFTKDSDSGVLERLMSQLLYWLQDSKARVFKVLTTNDMSKIPPELYREGRIDRVFNVSTMTNSQAGAFARKLITEMLKPHKATLKQVNGLQLIANPNGWSHAATTQAVITYIKENGWLKPS